MTEHAWLDEFLKGDHEILLVVALAPDGVHIRVGLRPELRGVSDELFDGMTRTMVEGMERLRTAPLDDLGRMGEWVRG